MSTSCPRPVDENDFILDAAERCFTEMGVRATTIEAIATAAGVSRITIYRRIGGRAQLVLLVLLRITDRFLATLQPRLTVEPNLGEAIVLLIRATVRAVRRDDLSLLFASEERGQLGAPIAGVVAPMSERFGSIIAALSDHFGSQLRATVRPSEAGEWLLRVIVSLVTLEGTGPRAEGETDRWVRAFVLPGLIAPQSTRSRRA